MRLEAPYSLCDNLGTDMIGDEAIELLPDACMSLVQAKQTALQPS